MSQVVTLEERQSPTWGRRPVSLGHACNTNPGPFSLHALERAKNKTANASAILQTPAWLAENFYLRFPGFSWLGNLDSNQD